MGGNKPLTVNAGKDSAPKAESCKTYNNVKKMMESVMPKRGSRLQTAQTLMLKTAARTVRWNKGSMLVVELALAARMTKDPKTARPRIPNQVSAMCEAYMSISPYATQRILMLVRQLASEVMFISSIE